MSRCFGESRQTKHVDAVKNGRMFAYNYHFLLYVAHLLLDIVCDLENMGK